ncbi:hypothetical protein AB1Y20_000706 [Prymnesium parvum]|uniref:Protein ENHANCED DISEASE RESISTANCE 2 C-terminal domain-containing protein n=1 Tax=Prymnesium parvum TaxID=97485 RepID=A0AB34KAB1_PRYPA
MAERAVALPPEGTPPTSSVMRRLCFRYGSASQIFRSFASLDALMAAASAVAPPVEASEARTNVVVTFRIAAEESLEVLKDHLLDSPENLPLLLSKQAEPLVDPELRARKVTRSSSSGSVRPTLSGRETDFEEMSAAPLVGMSAHPPKSAVELPEMVSTGGRHCWSALAPSSFLVRGDNYLKDRVKHPSATQSQLLAVELFRTHNAMSNVAGRPDAPTNSLHLRCEHPLLTIFVVVLVIPTGKFVVHLAMYFGVFDGLESEAPSASVMLNRFVHANDAWRNQRFKIIPKVSGGPLPVRLACPSRPAISGRTVPQRYFCTSKYIEVDMDVSKDAIANRALAIAKPVSKVLTVDMAFVLEGREADELPEMALGAGRFYHLDISDAAVPLLSR